MKAKEIENYDFEKVRNLLKENNLPYEDIRSSKVEFITSKSDNELVGCIGIEKYGEDGILRSFAVVDTFKNRGVGAKLITKLLDKSKNDGIQKLHLLTTTAHEYFLKHGFHISERIKAPKAVADSKEFSEICPSTSIYMVKELNSC
ncbi:arsenic resistance N-acetyltransferase ArsN2 [Flagellimonas sp. HMM57]|uniref:arsenic resistance N-acetyltransferase ArsN2 n=1 Tax=unclassified Flagellimonas TaxID=2644544 RepID=UPI0013D8A406|nr:MULTISPECIES: arsenic resistance N-acetyltransferase ArsN2 [unclassified Flagellimonas]UII76182.1 arsenic resistance N-acetyltransferase ArsN2 [Flagellimonas sp. HMM57]